MENNFIENELIILSKQTIDLFLKQDNSADLISLYTFYYYTAKWQKTNQPKATDGYVKKGLKMGNIKFRKAKDFLIKNGLISQVNTRKSNKITGWYIKMNYIWGNEKVKNDIIEEVPKRTSSFQETNALNANNINALNANNISHTEETEQKEDKITLSNERGKTPISRLQSLYGTLFNRLYGFKPKSSSYAQTGSVFKGLLKDYSEIQIACLLIVFFNWKGMNDKDDKENEWLVKNTHSPFQLKAGLNKYEAYIRNIAGWSEEFEDDEKLYPIVKSYFINKLST